MTSWPQDADEPTFGGREIDAVLEQYVEEYLTKALTPALAPNAHAFASAPGQAKMWKERNVSVNLAADKSVNTCAYIGVYRNTGVLKGEFPAFGRKEFEQIAASGLHDYVRLLKGCLDHTAEKDPQLAADGLDLVILTGGHSAWYFAREIVDGTMAGYLDHPSLKNIRDQKARVVNLANPQTTVSLGLVYSKLPFTSTRPKPEPKPDEPAKPNKTTDREVHPKPDGQGSDAVDPRRVLEIVRDAVANDPEFYEANQLTDSDLVSCLRKSYQIPAGAEILYVYALGDGEKAGHILADTGIYQKGFVGMGLGYSVTYFSWKDFILSDTVGNVYGTSGSYSYSGKKLAFSEGDGHAAVRRLYDRLHDEWRDPSLPGVTYNKKDDSAPSVHSEYDPSRCPACGSAIARDAKKCPVCGRAKLPELVTPYKFNSACWYVGEKKFGIEKASGPLTILDDRIELKRVFGNPPKAIFWMRDIASVREGSYGLNAPSIVITMKDGQAHTFVPTGNHDRTRGAVALIRRLIRR